MNKPSIKYIRLNNGDVISTSGGQVYFTMSGMNNGINGDLSLISSDGKQTFEIDDFTTPDGSLSGSTFIVNGEMYYGNDFVTNEENNRIQNSNGKYTFVYDESEGYSFTKAN